MTAFSFGKHPTIHQSNPFKRATVMVLCLRFTDQNEIANVSPERNLMSLLKTLQCQPSPESGIVLVRLLVSI